VFEAGLFFNNEAGLIGRATKLPEQLGQMKCNNDEAQVRQNVHSKLQIKASFDSGGKSSSQHSQLGFNINMLLPSFSVIH
jgi:hypothetical protein